MTNNFQTDTANIESRFKRVVLLLILLMVIVAAIGCGGNGKTDSRLVTVWHSGSSSLSLKSDGTYQMTLAGSIAPDSAIINNINKSGKWDVKVDRLNLKDDKSGAILTHRYQLNDIGNQLQLTLDSPLNPNGLTVNYNSDSKQ